MHTGQRFPRWREMQHGCPGRTLVSGAIYWVFWSHACASVGTSHPCVLAAGYTLDNPDNLLRLLYKHARKLVAQGGGTGGKSPAALGATKRGLSLSLDTAGSAASSSGVGTGEGGAAPLGWTYNGDKFGTLGKEEGSLVYLSRLKKNAAQFGGKSGAKVPDDRPKDNQDVSLLGDGDVRNWQY